MIRESFVARRIGSVAAGRVMSTFVPPPQAAVPDCMAALERFMHAR